MSVLSGFFSEGMVFSGVSASLSLLKIAFLLLFKAANRRESAPYPLAPQS